MDSINVRGLPGPIVRALQEVMEALRRQVVEERAAPDSRPTEPGNGGHMLEHRPGMVIGRLGAET